MKILFISNLFPDAQEPNRGIVNARLLRHMAADSKAEIRVIGLRPSLTAWTKSDSNLQALAEDAQFSPVFPFVPYVPRVGDRVNDALYARRLKPWVEKIRRSFDFDAVLCSWLYPDACAVARLSQELKFPYVAVAQGTDVHQYLHIPQRRLRIVETVNASAGTVARSQELSRLLIEAGARKDRLQVVYNGVEGDIFKLGDRDTARDTLGLPRDGKIVLYVGNLLPVKNPGLALESFHRLGGMMPSPENLRLIMVGAGPLETSLKARSIEAGLEGKIVWSGSQPAKQVALFLQAADVLCLPSDNEGLPNVMLEAMASGRPVVATSVGGIPEVLNRPELGRLVAARDELAMSAALRDVLESPAAVQNIAAAGAEFSWRTTALVYLEMLGKAATNKI